LSTEQTRTDSTAADPGGAEGSAGPGDTAPGETDRRPAALSGWTVLFFAVAGGVAVANVYFAQPLLVSMGRDFALSPATVGLVITATQVGYGVGLFLLVPLGDVVNRRRLIVGQFLLIAVSLAAVGSASGTAALLAGMAAVGLLAVVTQALVAYAATLAGPARRGRVVGLVTSGVVVGILCARAASGALADLAGWRAVYFTAAALALAIGLAAHRVLPRPAPTVLAPAALAPTGPTRPGRAVPYRRLLGSVFVLFRREPVFRARAVLALLVFGAFSTLWSSLALPLSAPPLALSHTAIGAFGLVGVAGAVAAVPAGRLNDRGLAGWTTGVALVLLTGSWAAIALTPRSLWALAAGAVLLDLAVQAVHVTNQSLIFELQPAAGSRLIGGYMIFYSVGSGAGAIGSTAVYAVAGWLGVCALGGTLSALALLWWAATTSAKKHGFRAITSCPEPVAADGGVSDQARCPSRPR